MKAISDGVWPTMITPFTEQNEPDLPVIDRLVEWYLARNVAGLFAVCQSSEMFDLTLSEKVHLAERTVAAADGRVQVIASGHTSDDVKDQVTETNRMAETGIDALVLITNRFAEAHESEETWKKRCSDLLNELPPDLPLGLYECPHPYKRTVSPQLLRWCADTGRFVFLKDTCCNADQIRSKLAAIRGTPLKLFNANAATYYLTLKMGANGYSGVMANFHPELYDWVFRNSDSLPDGAELLQNFLGMASLIERQLYPVNAKYYLGLEGIPIGLESRRVDPSRLTSANRLEIEQLRAVTKMYIHQYMQT